MESSGSLWIKKKKRRKRKNVSTSTKLDLVGENSIRLTVPRSPGTESQIKEVDRWKTSIGGVRRLCGEFFSTILSSQFYLVGYLCPEEKHYNLVRQDCRILACLWRYGTVNGRHRVPNISYHIRTRILISCYARQLFSFKKIAPKKKSEHENFFLKNPAI